MSKGSTLAPVVSSLALSALLVGDAMMSLAQRAPGPAAGIRHLLTEVKWPFPPDRWGWGRALAGAGQSALDFLNGDLLSNLVPRWTEKELGL